MYYDNEMKITMRTAKMAEKAMEILKNRLAAGFDCDEEYENNPYSISCFDEECGYNPSLRLIKNMTNDGRVIKISGRCGYYLPKDAMTIMCELTETLAKNLPANTFTFENCNYSEFDMSRVDATFKKGVLEIQTTYYPNGYCEEYLCPECGEVVVYAEDYVEGNTYFCPECGKEIDLSKQIPTITKKTLEIC